MPLTSISQSRNSSAMIVKKLSGEKRFLEKESISTSTNKSLKTEAEPKKGTLVDAQQGVANILQKENNSNKLEDKNLEAFSNINFNFN